MGADEIDGWEKVGKVTIHVRRSWVAILWDLPMSRLTEHTICRWRGHRLEVGGGRLGELKDGVTVYWPSVTYCSRCGSYRDEDGKGNL